MSEWIKHDGFGMPVLPETQVQVRLRDQLAIGVHAASAWKSPRRDCWSHRRDINDIIAYRIVEEA